MRTYPLPVQLLHVGRLHLSGRSIGLCVWSRRAASLAFSSEGSELPLAELPYELWGSGALRRVARLHPETARIDVAELKILTNWNHDPLPEHKREVKRRYRHLIYCESSSIPSFNHSWSPMRVFSQTNSWSCMKNLRSACSVKTSSCKRTQRRLAWSLSYLF